MLSTMNVDNKSQILQLIERKVREELTEPINKLLQEDSIINYNEIINRLDLSQIQDEICDKLDKNSSTPTFRIPDKHVEIWSSFDMDCGNYAAVIENLNGNSTMAKLRALDDLLNMQFVDTKQAYWSALSLCLRKCFVSCNNDIFIGTLRIHHRIIGFPNSCVDGYLSLLQGTILLLNSRYFSEISNTRVIKSLQLILDTQHFVIKSLLNVNHKVMEEVITTFVAIISSKYVICQICAMDKKAKWLEIFCYGSFVRSFIFKHLKQSDYFPKTILSSFCHYLTNSEAQFTDTEIHCSYVLSHLLSYRSNCDSFFPFQVDETRKISINTLIELTLNKINQHKSNELVDMISTIFAGNPQLLNSKMVTVLLHPLHKAEPVIDIAELEHRLYICHIVQTSAESNHFSVLFGNSCNNKLCRRPKTRQIPHKSVNASQKIVDLTAFLLKTCTESKEVLQQKYNLIGVIVQCCLSLYKSHSAALCYTNPTKLIPCLVDLYGFLLNGNTVLKANVLELIGYFYANYPMCATTMDCDRQILGDLAMSQSSNSKLAINRMATDTLGVEFLKSNYSTLIKPYLENIWYLYEQDDGDDQFEDAVAAFLVFISAVKLSYKATTIFLSYDQDGTIVNVDDKTVILGELVEKTLTGCDDFAEEYVGLLLIKVLMTNMDLMVHLQASYQAQESLEKLQDNSCLDGTNVLIVDANSSLRENIITCFRLAGFPGTNSDEDILQHNKCLENPLRHSEGSRNSSEIEILLNSDVGNLQRDFGWVLQARRAFKKSLEFLHPSVLTQLLEQIPKTYVYRKTELVWPPPDSVYYQLYPEDFCGISMIVNYGFQRKLLCPNIDHKENLMLLVKQTRVFMGHRPEEFSNFDWFVGIVYTITGDLEKCKATLMNFSSTPVSALIWSTFGKEFDIPLQQNFYQQLSVVIEENCQSFQALKLLGLHPEALVKSWMNQCFFNSMSLEEICNFLAFSVLYPPECLMYYIAAIFQHLDRRICTATHTVTIDNLLQMTHLGDFKLASYFHSIENLMKRYRNMHKL